MYQRPMLRFCCARSPDRTVYNFTEKDERDVKSYNCSAFSAIFPSGRAARRSAIQIAHSIDGKIRGAESKSWCHASANARLAPGLAREDYIATPIQFLIATPASIRYAISHEHDRDPDLVVAGRLIGGQRFSMS
ncbi:hypothetical protein [Labrenzia sp. CE80]|uniref:hypothetical protein n=1 Tax=Labrenzia sp. CE80 TaxID=1788986 RepID=UPI00129B7842|nr:hypothetical protein [Labrenzia sp. CE80]